MSTYIIIHFNLIDSTKLQEYSAAAGPIVAQYSGEFMAKGPVTSLSGEQEFTQLVIIMFPSQKEALGWYHSDAYQALTPLRESAMDAEFQLI